MLMNSLADNFARVQDRLGAAAQRVGRSSADIKLIAVSKTHPVEAVQLALASGLNEFGENRIEEAAPKMQALANHNLRWHMIGHIQSRKAREVVAAGFTLVHSVDSLKLAERLSRFAGELGREQAILLECNVSGEAQKSGFPASARAEWAALVPEVEQIARLPHLRLSGLMTMAPIVPNPEAVRPFFARLRELRDDLRAQIPVGDWRELSMGMTDDFEAGIAEGATLIRVGRAIFGERG